MKITYLFHSGFLIETAQCCYIFDYFQGNLPALPQKPLLIFASHAHHDHYNPEIFSLAQAQGIRQITAVLSQDIPVRRHPKDIEVVTVRANQDYALPFGLQLRTLHSTDCGVAFYLQTPEGAIYHAGDLNDWVWNEENERNNRQMTGNYRHEIDLLRGQPIDAAFVPLDPRQEEHYSRGLAYFLQTLSPRVVFPMHYWQQPETIRRFLKEYPQYRSIVKDTEYYKEDNPYALSNDS